MAATVTAEYCDGILEGRRLFKEYGIEIAAECVEQLDRLCRQFSADNPVGQLFRGERDFWRNQISKAAQVLA